LFAVETETYCQFQLGVTRSLGDFYLQHFGVSWEPAVRCTDTTRVEPLPTAVAASTACGDRLYHLRLQPPPPTVAGELH
jgi:hypothetical protein